MEFRECDWDRRLWPKTAIGRVQAARHVSRHRSPMTTVAALVLIGVIVGALALLGWALS